MGNKGAVAASLTVHTTSVCLVCSHLASGSSAVDARNLEFNQLLQRITFSGGPGGGGEGGGASSGGVGADEAAPSSVLDHDHVVWFGDLNYRINLDAEQTRTLARRDDIDALQACALPTSRHIWPHLAMIHLR